MMAKVGMMLGGRKVAKKQNGSSPRASLFPHHTHTECDCPLAFGLTESGDWFVGDERGLVANNGSYFSRHVQYASENIQL